MHPNPYDGWSDATLVDAARCGDREAFGELIRRRRELVMRVATRALDSPDLAGDVVQEASLLAMTSLDRLRSPERFGSWLCGIALNVARRWSADAQAFTQMPEVVPDTGATPEEQAIAAETVAAINDAVESLADGQRQAVTSVYLQGRTYRETAQQLDITLAAVRSRLHQARSNLEPKLTQLHQAKEQAMTTQTTGDWIEVDVSDVRRGTGPNGTAVRHAIVLSDKEGRTVPIWVGPFEATAIALHLAGSETPRPLTYQFASRLIAAADGRVEQVRITALAESVLYATVAVETASSTGEVDCRPRDALNLALECGAPIRLNRAVMEDSSLESHTEWRDYPDNAVAIAAEALQQLRS